MRYALFLLVSFNSMSLSAQSIAINKIKLAKKIDSLFQSYNNKNSPGIAITVLQNGKILTRKSYGLANTENQVPFTHQSVVKIPYSESREFISIAEKRTRFYDVWINRNGKWLAVASQGTKVEK